MLSLIAKKEFLENLISLAGPDGADEAPGASLMEQELRQALLEIYGVEDISELMYTHFREEIDPKNKERLRALGYVY